MEAKQSREKNIVDFCGKPLLAHSISHAINSSFIERVFVSSDCDIILDVAESYGAGPIKRPAELSLDHSSSEAAIAHFLEHESCDVVVFLQATSPLRGTEDIDAALKNYFDNHYDTLFSACSGRDLCVWNIKNENYSSLTYDFNNRKRRQDIDDLVIENGSFYVIDAKKFPNNENRLFGKIGHYLMDDWKVHEVDTEDDLELCRFMYEKRVKE